MKMGVARLAEAIFHTDTISASACSDYDARINFLVAWILQLKVCVCVWWNGEHIVIMQVHPSPRSS